MRPSPWLIQILKYVLVQDLSRCSRMAGLEGGMSETNSGDLLQLQALFKGEWFPHDEIQNEVDPEME